MGRRKNGEEHIRNLTKIGKKSYAVTIPIDIIKKLGLREKQRLIVVEKNKKIIISDY